MYGMEYPIGYKYERKIRSERPPTCDYCHRDAVYCVETGEQATTKLDDGSEFVGQKVVESCNLCFDEHFQDVEIVATLRQSGAKAAGRWGKENE